MRAEGFCGSIPGVTPCPYLSRITATQNVAEINQVTIRCRSGSLEFLTAFVSCGHSPQMVTQQSSEEEFSIMSSTSTDPASIQNGENQIDELRFRIFVYGSLKKGYGLHHLLEDQLRICDASTEPLYRLFDLGSYPGLMEWPDGISICGEIYEVSTACLQRLDEAEGVADGLYARRPIRLQAPGDSLPVYAWFWLGSVTGLRVCGHSWP